jgi:hypothetical protein
MRAAVLVLLLCLAGCAAQQPIVIPRIEYREIPVIVYRALPAERLVLHPIAEGPPSQCPAVAADRRAEIIACNADKEALRGLNPGTKPVD